jgi:starvation-inducible DNA-binding protein|nr:DNA starvation/stationary phase protection protein [uncultured Flavobacterium sp.]
MITTIEITKKKREGVRNELAKILANEYVLYTKTKNAHWNIIGPDFYDKYKFFEAQFVELETIIDSVAERNRIFGYYVDAMLKAFLSVSRFTEQKHEKKNSKGYLKELLTDHETLILSLRTNSKVFANKYDDLGTSDFITGLMESHEKMAWFLRSHLK